MRLRHRDAGFDLPRPRRHDDNPIGEKHCLGQRMGHEHDGLAGTRQKHRQILAQHHAGLLVERGERLVEQHHLGADAESARQIDALLHADRELLGIMIGELLHADRRKRLHGAVAPAVLDAQELEREAEILQHRVPGQQRAFLEHEGNVIGSRAIDRLAGDGDRTRGRLQQAADDAEQRALAAARGAEQADEFALADFQRHVVERQHGLRGVAPDEIHRDVIDRDGGGTRSGAPRGVDRCCLGAHVRVLPERTCRCR
jgi:hypothetical protein